MFNKSFCLYILSVYLSIFQICSAQRNSVIVRMGHNTVLDGFTVTGAADACILGENVDFTVENCVITNSQDAGVHVINGNVFLKWCDLKQNGWYAVYHEGEGFTLQVDNTHIRKNQRWGIFCQDSTLFCTNSIVSEADLSETGNAGITMFNPWNRPFLQNMTVAHNKSVGIWRVGGALPEIQNSIIFHNSGPALAGFSADEAAWYSCIEDANSVNYNINVDPQFAYFDPNNVRLSPASLCLNASNPYLDYSSQLDMDGNPRVYGAAPDMGAYELTCDMNVSNEWDWNADGLVNLVEFARFSRVWRAHDPNDPALTDPDHVDYEYRTDPNSPGYVTASSLAAWYPDGHTFNYVTTGHSQYAIDLADLIFFLEDAPWLWTACWRTDLQPEMRMTGFGEESLLNSGFELHTFESQAISEKVTQEQVLELAMTIVQLENLWLEEPDVQQQIDADDWRRFMEAVYQSFHDIATETIQRE